MRIFQDPPLRASSNSPPQRLRALAALAGPALLLAACATPDFGAPPEAPFNTAGLERVESGRFDHVYIGSAADLAAFDGYWVDPPSVAFDPRWRPVHPDVDRPLQAEEREALRAEMAERFSAQLARWLPDRGEGAERPLRAVPALVDFSLQPIPRGRAVGGGSLDYDSGEATFLVDLIDPRSGQVLARIADRRAGPRLPRGGLMTFGADWEEAVDDLFARWALDLAAWLDSPLE